LRGTAEQECLVGGSNGIGADRWRELEWASDGQWPARKVYAAHGRSKIWFRLGEQRKSPRSSE
jgi:hypothetical protein